VQKVLKFGQTTRTSGEEEMRKRKETKIPDSVEIILSRGSQYLAEEKYIAALREFQIAHDSNPQAPEVLFNPEEKST